VIVVQDTSVTIEDTLNLKQRKVLEAWMKGQLSAKSHGLSTDISRCAKKAFSVNLRPTD
jgi:hypothetical protein